MSTTAVRDSQNPLHQFPRSESVTSSRLPCPRGSYAETGVVDFGHIPDTNRM